MLRTAGDGHMLVYPWLRLPAVLRGDAALEDTTRQPIKLFDYRDVGLNLHLIKLYFNSVLQYLDVFSHHFKLFWSSLMKNILFSCLVDPITA